MILVTGGTGLIGSHLLAQFAQKGKMIRVLKRSSSDTSIVSKIFHHYNIDNDKLNLIEWIDGGVEDFQSLKQALADIDEVYHCAALVSFSSSDLQQMLDINVQGTANMVDACLEANVSKFCHVSSIASLGSPVDSGMVDENSAWGKTKGKSGYAISKFLSEMEVWRGMEQGLNAVIVNPSVIIGPGKWDRGSGMIFGTISKGFPFFTRGVSGYVDVRDVVDAMIIAMEREQWGKRFLLNGQNVSHKEVFELIAVAMGKKPPSIEVKPWMSNLAWPLAWVASRFTSKATALTRDTARSGHNKTYYSSSFAEETLGIKFRPISDAVSNTVTAGVL